MSTRTQCSIQFFAVLSLIIISTTCHALAPRPVVPPHSDNATTSDNQTDNYTDNRTVTGLNSNTIKIASFNIKVFGRATASKPEVMRILANIISRFDIVAIQEIRDNSGTAIQALEAQVDSLGRDYSCIVGPRMGRSTSKEQYAFMYRTDTLQTTGSYTFDDTADIFERPPYIAYFKVINGKFDFVLIDIHTAPDAATAEISGLPAVITDAKQHFNEQDVITLGDFNADCDYFNENSYSTIFDPAYYGWIIPNSADTNIASSKDCTYDRIVITASGNEDYTGQYGVYRFDDGMTLEAAEDVSDHRPVWAEFYIGQDID